MPTKIATFLNNSFTYCDLDDQKLGFVATRTLTIHKFQPSTLVPPTRRVKQLQACGLVLMMTMMVMPCANICWHNYRRQPIPTSHLWASHRNATRIQSAFLSDPIQISTSVTRNGRAVKYCKSRCATGVENDSRKSATQATIFRALRCLHTGARTHRNMYPLERGDTKDDTRFNKLSS